VGAEGGTTALLALIFHPSVGADGAGHEMKLKFFETPSKFREKKGRS
jgi:hypothetical protein